MSNNLQKLENVNVNIVLKNEVKNHEREIEKKASRCWWKGSPRRTSSGNQEGSKRISQKACLANGNREGRVDCKPISLAANRRRREKK